MADTKITALTAISTVDPAVDVFPIVDVSDTTMAASGTTKKITSNQLLGAGGTATLASATITGDLTVDTSTLKVDSTNNRVGVGTASPSGIFHAANLGTAGTTADNFNGYFSSANRNCSIYLLAKNTEGSNFYFGDGDNNTIGGIIYDHTSNYMRFDANGSEQMRLNSTGLGVGVSPGSAIGNLQVGGSSNANLYVQQGTDTIRMGVRASGRTGIILDSSNATYTNRAWYLDNAGSSGSLVIGRQGLDVITFDNSGNVGIGVTPSAWNYGKVIEFGGGSIFTDSGNNECSIAQGAYNNAGWKYKYTGLAVGLSSNYLGTHAWYTAPSGTAGNAITWTQAMTLDASGNLLVGTTTANGKITLTQSANSDSVYLTGSSGNFFRLYGWSVDNTWNANATAMYVGKQTSTSRSINAGGTVNASGADYAEYMTKAGDFVLSKGDVAGIDANGKLTNVFADAVSFVVKSTDPSYVGNDKWGVALEGDALEAARQLVDRIAFAGQVPVNVTGAKAGDYIVPVVDGTGIKGIAVSNPTFEQYQLAVGKVIAIDADGRARIIVKVA